MSSTWRSPKVWLNATLGWIAKAFYETSHHPWLRSLFGSERSLDHQDNKSSQQTERSHRQSQSQNKHEKEHELEFLNQFAEVFPDLELVQSSSDRLNNDRQDLHDLDASHDDVSSKYYADQLLLNDQDLIPDLDSTDHSLPLKSSYSIESQNQDTLDDQSPPDFNFQDLSFFQDKPNAPQSSPQGITKVKLYDEEREKRKAERRKRRRRKRRRERRERRNKQTQSHDIESNESHPAQEIERNNVSQDESMPSESLPKALNTWQRPPLRSLSKWERMGHAQMSQWQRYSPSSKALLFGSWFASLESLVEVDREMKKEREQFYQLVEDHEEFSSFSATELDAWWFQLNRVDYFVTEYQFQKKLEMQNARPLSHSLEQSLTESDQLESSDQLNTYENQNTVQNPIVGSKLEIKTFSPVLDPSSIDESPIGHFESDEQTDKSSLNRINSDSSRSIDSNSGQGRTVEEDIILRPIKKRKRRSKRKL